MAETLLCGPSLSSSRNGPKTSRKRIEHIRLHLPRLAEKSDEEMLKSALCCRMHSAS